MKYRLITSVLVLSSFSAEALNFKSNMQPLKLPVSIAMSLPPEQPESAPGELTVGLQRMCGDGDVAHLAHDNPQIEFVPQSTNTMNVVAGYWIVDGAATADNDFVPTPSTFMPVAYVKDAQVGNNPGSISIAKSFLPINHALTTGKNGLEILASEVVGIYKNAGRAFGNTKSYRVFSGVFTCMNMDDAGAVMRPNDSNYKYMPSSVELSNLMSHDNGLPGMAYDAIKNLTATEYAAGNYPQVAGYQIGSTTDGILNSGVDSNNAFKPLKVYFDKNNSSLKTQTGASSVSDSDIQTLMGTGAGSKFSTIMALNFPNLNNAPVSSPRPVEAALVTQSDLEGWVTLLPSSITPPSLNDPITSAHLAGWDSTHPTDADKVAYLQNQINQWRTNFNFPTGLSVPQKLAYCDSIGLQTNTETKTYKWEAFPLNSSCKKFFNAEPGTSVDSMPFEDALAQFLPSSIPTMAALVNYQNNFFRFKKAIATRFFVANALEVVQRKANNSDALKISHANCFNTNGKPLITRLIGSYPLRYNLSATSGYSVSPNPLNHIHPEPLFALHDWKDYRESDMLGLWGQVVSRQPTYPAGAFAGLSSYGGVDLSSFEYGSIDLASYTPPVATPAEPLHPSEWGIFMPVNDKTQLNNNSVNGATFKGPAINILFKIRSIGGNCPGFC